MVSLVISVVEKAAAKRRPELAPLVASYDIPGREVTLF
jgi:hypothetical protein